MIKAIVNDKNARGRFQKFVHFLLERCCCESQQKVVTVGVFIRRSIAQESRRVYLACWGRGFGLIYENKIREETTKPPEIYGGSGRSGYPRAHGAPD